MAIMTSGAKRCVDPGCGTTGGWVYPGQHKPWRIRGLCRNCFDYHKRHDTLGGFPAGKAGGHGYRIRGVSEVRQMRRAHIAARVALHESKNTAEMVPILEGEVDAAAMLSNALRSMAAWVGKHPGQLLTWQNPDEALFGAANASDAAA